MVDFEDLKVKDLVELAEKESIYLPEFQRPFVWDKSQIKLLIDSLYNDYTISSILVWPGTDELARRRVGGSLYEIEIPKQNKDEINYLLDGQQRTTTLTLVFTDKKIFKKKNKRPEEVYLYFDTEYQGEDFEDRFVFHDEEFLFNEEEVKFSDYSEKEIFEKFGTRFVSLKDVYYNDVNKIKENIEDDKLVLDYILKIQKLKERLLDRRVNAIVQKGDLDKVLEIFERINTKNTKLNVFDIMVAKTYKKLSESEYFDLRTFLNIIRNPDGIKQDYIFNKENFGDENFESYLDEGDLMFLVMLMIQDKKTFRQKDILTITSDELIENQKLINKQYVNLFEKVKEFNIEGESVKKVRPILKFLTAFLSTKNKLSIEDNKFIQKWFWNTLIYNRYPGAQNERVARDFKLSMENSYEKAIEIMKKDRSRNLSEEFIDVSYDNKNPFYSTMEILFFNNNVQDFYNGINTTKSNKGRNKLEMHHIFPFNSKIGKQIRKETENDEDKYNLINNIANLSPLTKDTNNRIIKNKNPSDYIKEFEKEYKENNNYDEFVKIMKSQFITEEMIEMLKNDDFYSFIEKRTQLIKKKITNLCD